MDATKRIQDAMSELLGAIGFEAMAREVKTEEELSRLQQYARIIVKNAPVENKMKLANLFRLHRPALY